MNNIFKISFATSLICQPRVRTILECLRTYKNNRQFIERPW